MANRRRRRSFFSRAKHFLIELTALILLLIAVLKLIWFDLFG
jgi:hypothetical protein